MEKELIICPVDNLDHEAILKMNEADVNMLSEMDEEILEKVIDLADLFLVARIDDRTVAFLIAYRENSSYWSDNYAWFNKRFDKFLYIDRVVVDKDHRRLGIATRLYEKALEEAIKDDVPLLTAEIDIMPEYNKESMAFHKKLGFHQIDTKLFRKKITVSLQVKETG